MKRIILIIFLFLFSITNVSAITLSDRMLLDDTGSETVSEAIQKIEEKGTPLFNVAAKTKDGLFKDEDEFGDTYYYRGSADHNYVSFAGYLWRIVRRNGDGSVRLIYTGTKEKHTKTYTYVKTSPFNTSATKKDDISYVYPNGTDSAVKKVSDSWYETNILNKQDEDGNDYSNYLVDIPFCNDRSVVDNGSTVSIRYGALQRLNSDKAPSLICPREEDKLSVSNNKLKYPVALITGDEVEMAGVVFSNVNTDYYLNVGTAYWTMSPSNFNVTYSYGYVLFVFSSGGMSNGNHLNTAYGVRPVLNLAKEVLVVDGTGSEDDPYVVGLEKKEEEKTPEVEEDKDNEKDIPENNEDVITENPNTSTIPSYGVYFTMIIISGLILIIRKLKKYIS